MNILYIDKANSLDEIRIAERTIWVDEMPKFGYEMFFLLKKIKKNLSRKNNELVVILILCMLQNLFF